MNRQLEGRHPVFRHTHHNTAFSHQAAFKSELQLSKRSYQDKIFTQVDKELQGKGNRDPT